MLTVDEIRKFINEDDASDFKRRAREGQRYYEGRHDILDYKMFYWDADGNLVEDKTRSNVKIPHPFYTELIDQGTQHILSGEDGIFHSNDTGLQKQLDLYFNKNRTFKAELSDTITGQQGKGCEYMFAFKKNDRLNFESVDCLGVVEVEGRFANDGKEQRIWRYVDRIDKDGHTQWKILVIDDENIYYYCQTDDGEIRTDDSVEINPKPHALYTGKDGKLYQKDFGFLPLFRLDMNKKRVSLLPAVKPLIDDYDLMASSLTNNLVDFDNPLYVVKGFPGNDLDELLQNLKTQKAIGVPAEGTEGVEIKTVEIPFEARKAKLELDERAIYKFGMGLNMEGLKDTSATTNIAIKAAYSLLELRCKKMRNEIEKFLEEILTVVLAEINAANGTDYTVDMVDFVFKPEIMSNAQENAAIELTEAQRKQVEVNTLQGLANTLDDETIVQRICEVMEIDYEEIKGKLPKPEEDPIPAAKAALAAVVTEDEPEGVPGDVIE